MGVVTRDMAEGEWFPLENSIAVLERQILSQADLRHGNALHISVPDALREFSLFASSFDLGCPEIAYKREHTLRVALVADEIAREESMAAPDGAWVPDESVCFLMGLLHDVGRFPQWAMWRTYSDTVAFPHAQMSYEMLAKQGFLRQFVPSLPDGGIGEWPDEAQMLCEAIRCHAMLSIDCIAGHEARTYAHVVRDADKIDIVEACAHAVTAPGFMDRVQQAMSDADAGVPPAYEAFEAPFIRERVRTADKCGHVSDAVYADVMGHRIVDRRHMETAEDGMLCTLCLAFDMGTTAGMEILRRRGSVPAIAETIPSLYGSTTGKVDRRLIRCVEEVVDFVGK